MKKQKAASVPAPRIFLTFDSAIKLHLRVYVYQARDLLPMGQDSFSGNQIDLLIRIDPIN